MAQVDTSIYGNLLRAPKSVQEYQAEADALEANRTQNLLGRMKLDEAKRSVADEQAYRSAAMNFGADTEANASALLRAGLPSKALAYQKSVLEGQETQAKIGKEKAQTAKYNSDAMSDALKRYKGALDYIDTPEGAARWLQAQYQDPALALHMQALGPIEEAVKRIPTDPAAFQQWRQQAGMGMEAFEKQQLAKEQQKEVMRRNLAVEGLTARGQDMTASTARRGQDISASTARRGQDLAASTTIRGQDLTDKRTREGGASQSTEGERNAAGYASRMTEATKLLDRFEGSGKTTYLTQAAGAVPMVGGALQRNVMNADQQRYKQAADDWIRAKLRKESGAVIGEGEMAAEYATYFPMPGDTPQVVEQKRQARETANQAMIQSGGRAVSKQEPARAAGASGSWGEGWSIQPVK